MIKEKHSAAPESMYDEYSADMYGLICSLTDDKALAEKILEASFIKLWDKKTLSRFEYLPFLDIMRHTYLNAIKELQQNPEITDLALGESGTIMHFLSLKCISASDIAYILDIPLQEVGRRLRTESLRLRQL